MVSTYGKATLAHFVLELLSKEANIQLNHVPYKGPPETLTALLGGHVDAAICTGVGGLTDFRVLAVAVEKRLEDRPDIPTFSELGYPIALEGGYSFFVHRKTPKEIVEKLIDAQKKAYERYPKEIKEALRRVEISPQIPNPEEASQKYYQKRELITKMAREMGLIEK